MLVALDDKGRKIPHGAGNWQPKTMCLEGDEPDPAPEVLKALERADAAVQDYISHANDSDRGYD
jgi:hypothetical protein